MLGRKRQTPLLKLNPFFYLKQIIIYKNFDVYHSYGSYNTAAMSFNEDDLLSDLESCDTTQFSRVSSGHGAILCDREDSNLKIEIRRFAWSRKDLPIVTSEHVERTAIKFNAFLFKVEVKVL